MPATSPSSVRPRKRTALEGRPGTVRSPAGTVATTPSCECQRASASAGVAARVRVSWNPAPPSGASAITTCAQLGLLAQARHRGMETAAERELVRGRSPGRLNAYVRTDCRAPTMVLRATLPRAWHSAAHTVGPGRFERPTSARGLLALVLQNQTAGRSWLKGGGGSRGRVFPAHRSFINHKSRETAGVRPLAPGAGNTWRHCVSRLPSPRAVNWMRGRPSGSSRAAKLARQLTRGLRPSGHPHQ